MSPKHAQRIRRGINRARREAAQGVPSMLFSTDELEQRAYRRIRDRYRWADFAGWKVALPPVPPITHRGLRWVDPVKRGARR